MSLQELAAESDLSAAVTDEIAALVALKAVTREMGRSLVPEPLSVFIVGELTNSGWIAAQRSAEKTEAARAEAAAFFRDAVSTYGPSL